MRGSLLCSVNGVAELYAGVAQAYNKNKNLLYTVSALLLSVGTFTSLTEHLSRGVIL